MRVFVPEIPRRIDVSGAKKFGKIIPIFDEQERRESIFHCEKFGLDVIRRLDELEFDHESDYLCVSGKQLLTILVVLAAATRYSQVRLLVFDAARDEYVCREINLEKWGVNGNVN